MVYERKPGIFYTSDVTTICGVKRPRLQQWIDKGLVNPSYERASVPGQQNKWLGEDLVRVCVVKMLLDFGLSRKAIGQLYNSHIGGYVADVETDGSEYDFYYSDDYSRLNELANRYETDFIWHTYFRFGEGDFEGAVLFCNHPDGYELVLSEMKTHVLSMRGEDKRPIDLMLTIDVLAIAKDVDTKAKSLGIA